MTVYLLLVALLVVERLFELALSRRNAARARDRGAIEVGREHFRLMAAVHVLFLAACLVEPPLQDRHPWPVVSELALVGVAASQALRYWAVYTLGDRWNVRILVIPGASPITAGPYRFVRHPNYLAVAIELLCVPLVGGAWLTAVAFSLANAALLRVRIQQEEEALGEGWARSFADKPRFLPRRRNSPRGRGADQAPSHDAESSSIGQP